MEVIWTDMATQQLGNIVKYVESEFGRSIAVKTLDKINSKIIRLSHFPESGIYTLYVKVTCTNKMTDYLKVSIPVN